jgi:glycosyltransferase involved in cell wall biosynthesis
MRPKVSIVIPIYNTAKDLPCCLDSLINQTLSEIEIICVNDASPDNALEIIYGYIRQDDRLKLIDFPRNLGVSQARNTGMRAAVGEYLAFVDSDDYVDFDFLRLLYDETRNNPNVDIVKGNLRVLSQNKILRTTNNDKIKDNKFYFTCFYTTAIYKKEFVEAFKIDFPDGILRGQDLIFSSKAVICARKIAFADAAFYNYTPSGKGGNMSMLQVQTYLEACHMVIDYANQAEVEPQGYMIVFNYLVNSLCTIYSNEVSTNRESACRMIRESFIRLYAKCKYKETLLAIDPSYIHKFLLDGDLNILVMYLRKQHLAQIAAQLRIRARK